MVVHLYKFINKRYNYAIKYSKFTLILKTYYKNINNKLEVDKMGLGIVPVIQTAVMGLPWPSGIRSLLLHPAGPFTSKYSIFNSFIYSLLLGSYLQVDDHNCQCR